MLQEELWFRKLRNRFFKKPNKIEEEIGLRRQRRKKIDNIEELKERVEEWEFKSVKILQDFNFEKYDEIVEIAKIELKLERSGISKKSLDKCKKLVIPKKYLHLVLQVKNKTLYNITKSYSMFNC